MSTLSDKKSILVIRLGALGDLVLCAPQFQAIRQAVPHARITLLTMPAFAAFGQLMPWFDAVVTDPRAPFWHVAAWRRLLTDLTLVAPDAVIDLQGKSRQGMLYHLLGIKQKKILWSGAVNGCSHPRPWPPQPHQHVSDFFNAQIKTLAITPLERADFSWLQADITAWQLPKEYVVFIPGSSPDRLYKRWPAAYYAELAWRFTQQGLAVVAVGSHADADAVQALCRLSPAVIDLCGQTSLTALGSVLRGARAVIGNDTGPTHMAAAMGTPTLALFSEQVNPIWSCPKGQRTQWLQGKPVTAITVDAVAEALAGLGVR